jgi:large subunit ribosomal protein L13
VDIPLRKREKEYVRHSGYPGGQKFETLAKLSARRGYSEIVRRAIYGMLPKNKLRVRMMHELTITE